MADAETWGFRVGRFLGCTFMVAAVGYMAWALGVLLVGFIRTAWSGQ